MSFELELLDQLQGGDLPLGIAASLFPDEAHARRAIAAMIAAGELELIDGKGAVLSSWQRRELEHQLGSWRADSVYRLSMTEAGARRIGC